MHRYFRPTLIFILAVLATVTVESAGIMLGRSQSMHKYFRPTLVFILAVLAVITVYDVWAVTHHYQWTISANLLQIAIDWHLFSFLFCFGLGILVGHLFPNSPSGE